MDPVTYLQDLQAEYNFEIFNPESPSWGTEDDSGGTTSSDQDYSDAVSSINLDVPAPTTTDQDNKPTDKDTASTTTAADEALKAYEQATPLGKLTSLINMLNDYRELKDRLEAAEKENKRWRKMIDEGEGELAEQEMLLNQEELEFLLLRSRNASIERQLRNWFPDAFDAEESEDELTGFEVTERPKVRPGGTKRSKGSRGSSKGSKRSKRKASGRKPS